jgi:hypothetical protein
MYTIKRDSYFIFQASICRKPSKRVGKVVYNCRVAATIMYDIVQRCDEAYHSSGKYLMLPCQT